MQAFRMSKEINKEEKKKAVIISCFDWFEKRLKQIKEVLEETGYTVIVFTSDYDHIKKEKINKKRQDCIYIPVKEYKKNVSIDRLHSHYLFAKEVAQKLYSICPDLIYALVPPNSVADVCGKYKQKQPNVKLIFDVIDMWPESLPGEKYHNILPFKYWKKLRDNGLREADRIFTECAFYQEKLEPDLWGKCSTLFLYKEDDGIYRTMARRENQRECRDGRRILKLCYLGSINHIIDIDGIYQVVKLLSKSYAVDVKIIGKGERTDVFLDTLNKTGAKINYYGAIYDEAEKFRLLCNCDFALNMMIESVNVGLTIKSIDYLSYGLPLINNIKGDTWKLVETENIGVNLRKDKPIEILPEIEHDFVYAIYRKYFTKNAFIKSLSEGFKGII